MRQTPSEHEEEKNVRNSLGDARSTQVLGLCNNWRLTVLHINRDKRHKHAFLFHSAALYYITIHMIGIRNVHHY